MIEIVVIGGGAAGMMAAITAARQGGQVTLLEPNERLGKKLNITGKGRCNVTNDCDQETLMANIPGNGRFLYSALTRFTPQDAMALFEGLGVPLKVERGNRVFPVSDRSFDISGALERELRRLHVRWVRDRAREITVQDGHVTGVQGEKQHYPASAAVLATGGDTHLGGDDFDQRIVEYAVAEFKKSDRIDLTRDPAAMGRLKEEAEKAKKELSSALSAQLNLPFIAVGKDGPHHLDLSLGRPQFEMMTGDLLARTVQPVQNALRDAGISASQLGKVLLVGGSTRMPAVERQVRELLGCEPSHSLNPDECVAMGAAVQGALLQGGGKLAGATGAAAQGLVLMDVTPLTLSIETLGGVATPLITRNSMIPTRKSQIFTTARPMQTSVEINVLQGERHFARDNKSLGKFKLNGIRASFSSKPQIEVTFDIDVNGVVKVSAKDLGTGREQNITITGSTNLSENEIQRAMADAAAYEAEDSRRKERLELHNQAEVLAYKVDEALSKCKKELDKDEKARVKADLANLRRCLRKDKPEKMNETEEAALRQAKSQLETSANHLMLLYSAEQTPGDGTDSTL